MRRIIITVIAFFSITFCCVFANTVFSGPICMRGKAEGNNFESSFFSIEFVEEKFVISCKQKKNKFALKTDARVLKDAVISINQSAAAVSLRKSKEWGDPQAVLATINVSGETRIYKFKVQSMTEHFGWLIELGAVSDDGKFILAKCATFLPEENGVQWVNHRWTILAIADGSLKVLEVLELEAALTKWAEYASVNRK